MLREMANLGFTKEKLASGKNAELLVVQKDTMELEGAPYKHQEANHSSGEDNYQYSSESESQ